MDTQTNGHDTPQTNGHDTEFPLAEETASGDLRDFVISCLRGMQKPFNELAEHEQKGKILQVTFECDKIIRRMVRMIAAAERPNLVAVIKAIAIKDEVEFKVVAPRRQAADFALGNAYEQETILIMPEVARYLGERAPAKPDPDQKDLIDEIDKNAAEQAMDQAATPPEAAAAEAPADIERVLEEAHA